MHYNAKQISRLARILFPIVVTLVTGLVAPDSLSLVGMLMFGNLIRESGALKSLSETAQNSFSNIITLLLGITISFQMQAEQFVQWETLMIMGLGLFAFVFDTAGGVMCAKFMNLFSKEKSIPWSVRRAFPPSPCPRASLKNVRQGRPVQSHSDARRRS